MGIKLKIFIYGGTGYIGRSLISGLSHKYQVFASSRNKKKTIKKINILSEKEDKKKIEQKLRVSDIILIANGPSFEDSKKNLFSYVKYLDKQLEFLLKEKKKNEKIIYFSSIHVYENHESQEANTSILLNSRSHYGIRNIVCENLLLSKFKKKNINIIRLSNIFGIQKNLSKLSSSEFRLSVNNFCLNVVNNKKFLINSNLNEKRNFISINDFVNFIEKGFILNKYKFNQIINYTSRNEISLKQLINIIRLQSKKLKLKKPNIKFTNKTKNSKINYKFKIDDIINYRLEAKILIKDEIKNTLKKIQKLM